jgi:hypothetical protein
MHEQLRRPSVRPVKPPQPRAAMRMPVRRPVPSADQGAVLQRACSACAPQAEQDEPAGIPRTLSQPGDRLEREADHAADRVMRAAEPAPPRLSRAAASPGASLGAAPLVQEALRSGGQPLPAQTRAFMEPRFGHDFGGVRVHTGAEASRSAEAVAARAYTVGNDVVFRAGAYQPHAPEGAHLIAHELAHVVQQSRGGGASLQRQKDDQPPTKNQQPAKDQPPAKDAPQPAKDAPQPAKDPTTPDDEAISIPPITGQGEPREVEYEGTGAGGCDGLVLHGSTKGKFDGGKFKIENEKARQTRAKGGRKGPCGCDTCISLTGILVITYTTTEAKIGMPEIPDDLTKCGKEKVKEFLDKVLGPHEAEHKRRLETYTGVTRRPISVTGCTADELQTKVAAMHRKEARKREDDVDKFNKKIDPFVRQVDCSACYGYDEPDDPLNQGGFGPEDSKIRVRPGPVRTTQIRPRTPAKSP